MVQSLIPSNITSFTYNIMKGWKKGETLPTNSVERPINIHFFLSFICFFLFHIVPNSLKRSEKQLLRSVSSYTCPRILRSQWSVFIGIYMYSARVSIRILMLIMKMKKKIVYELVFMYQSNETKMFVIFFVHRFIANVTNMQQINSTKIYLYNKTHLHTLHFILGLPFFCYIYQYQ